MMKEKPTYKELLENVSDLRSKLSALEGELTEYKAKHEKLKERFLASISHELRTPMNAILGFSNLMVDKNLPPEKKEEYIDHISQNSNNLLNIVDTMIDISLLQSNELRIRKERINLDMLMQQIYRYANIERHKMGKDHIAMLLNNYRYEGEFTAYTDPQRLSQVLSGLLHNSLKFTQKGIIEFGYFLTEDHKLQFFVKDSGKGILGENAKSIFNKFEKLDEDFGKKEGGVGLGLSLAKGIIKLLGGDIWVESNIFNGSTFNFEIDYMEQDMNVEDMKQKQNNSFHSMFV